MDHHHPKITTTQTGQILGVHWSVTLQEAMVNHLGVSTAMQSGKFEGTAHVREDKRKHEVEIYNLIHPEVKAVWLQ